MIRAKSVVSAFALASVLAFAGYLNAEDTKGTVKSVDTGKHEVVLKGTLRNTIYELNKDAAVSLDGITSKLAELKEGDQAVVTYEKKGEHYMASEIRGLRDAKETTGAVHDVFKDKNEITLKGVIKNSTYELNKSATVWLNGSRAKLADIRAGDQVLITYQEKGDHYMAACVRATRK